MILRALPFLFIASTIAARATVEDVFDIIRKQPTEAGQAPVDGVGDGGCTQEYIDGLKDQWPQMQDVPWFALEIMLKMSGKNTPPASTTSFWNFLAIMTIPLDDTIPKEVTEKSSDKRARTRIVLRGLLSVLTNGNYPWKHAGAKTQLYCDSRPIRYWSPDREIPESVGDGLLKDQTWYDKNKWYWFNYEVTVRRPPRSRKGAKKGAFIEESKIPNDDGTFPDEPPYHAYDEDNERDNPTFCRRKDRQFTYARTILHRNYVGWRDIKPVDTIIICPADRERKDPVTHTALSSKIDTDTQYDEDTDLDQLRPQWFTLYVEILYQVLSYQTVISESVFDGIIEGPPAPWAPDEAQTAQLELQASKDVGFATSYRDSIQTAAQCLVVARWDKAETFSDRAHSRSLRSMSNLAWHAITLYLWYRSPVHQTWGTGRCVTPPASDWNRLFNQLLPNLPNEPLSWEFKHKTKAREKGQADADDPEEAIAGEDIGPAPGRDNDPGEGSSNTPAKRPRPDPDCADGQPEPGFDSLQQHLQQQCEQRQAQDHQDPQACDENNPLWDPLLHWWQGYLQQEQPWQGYSDQGGENPTIDPQLLHWGEQPQSQGDSHYGGENPTIDPKLLHWGEQPRSQGDSHYGDENPTIDPKLLHWGGQPRSQGDSHHGGEDPNRHPQLRRRDGRHRSRGDARRGDEL